MRIIKSRPLILLRSPKDVYAGGTFEAAVVLFALRDVELDHLDVELRGVQRWQGSRSSRSEVCRFGARLAGRVQVPPGRSLFPFRLALPADLPPSYHGKSVSTWYDLHVHASIPWWVDRWDSFPLWVRAPRVPASRAPVGVPRVYSTSPQGPRAREPYVEVSLATDVVRPGDELAVAVALENCAFNRYTAIRISLVCREDVARGVGADEVEVGRTGMEVTLDRPQDGVQNSFRLRVPTSLHPSLESAFWSLRWSLEVEVERALAINPRISCPITVTLDTGRAPGGDHGPPSVGSPRVQAIWQRVAAEAGMSLVAGRLHVQVEDVAVDLRREHRGRRGLFLVGELHYPSLNVGLHLRVGAPWRGPRLAVDGREPQQIAPIRDALMPAVAQLAVEAVDTRATCQVRNAGQDIETLRRVARALMTSARELAAARARIPPPAALADGIGAWRRLAERLGGRLETGDMSVSGTFAGGPATVATVWDLGDQPLHTAVTLRAPFPLRAQPLPDGYTIDDDDHVLRTHLPAPLVDPAPALEALSQMSLLCERLGPSAGVYR